MRGRPRIRVAPADERRADGITFDSKAERERYLELKALQAGGAVKFFLRQPPFDLGGGTTWRGDFLVFWTEDDAVTIEDVKGQRTEAYKKAKRQVEGRYPIEITEIDAKRYSRRRR